MFFSKELKKNFSTIKSTYDLTAYCYYYLRDTIRNQIIFLGDYIERNEKAKKINPNIEMLNKFSMQIKTILKEYPYKIFSSEEGVSELLELVESAEENLLDFQDDSMNYATIPFFILLGLDLYFQDCERETFKVLPLNECCKDFCLIYLKCRFSLMDRIILDKDYPETICANEIRYYFKYIIILERRELPAEYGIPKLITLIKEEDDLKKIVAANKLRIAVVPAICNKWFEFSVKCGASFEVEYDERQLEIVKKRIIALLNWAITCKVNIIIFPEYVCKEEIQSGIREALLQISLSQPEKLKELLFVAAGSGWTDDLNNVSCLYSYDGEPLGKVYKYSAYDNYIDGFCLKLSKVFDTQFLLIAAWSSSVNIGFKKQMDAIISSNHKTCTAMCNCCAAFSDSKEFREEIGVIAAPQKTGSLVEGRYEYLKREKQKCDSSCQNGCIFDICFDFDGTPEQDVGITYDFRKKP